jgi:transcriptional regulator with XRE-family HTH domain
MVGTEIVGRNLRRFREERQFSLGEVCRRAGVAKQTVAGLEAGTGNPTVDTLERIAGALGVSIRALLTEMGTEVAAQRSDEADWLDRGPLEVRHLDQAYGSGYVTNSVLRLEAERGVSYHQPGGRGSLRHCYVLAGRVRLGPVGAPTAAGEGDFVRFPAEAPHLFQALSPRATILVCTTAPQLTMATDETAF